MTTADDFIEAIKTGEMDQVKQLLDRAPSLVDAKADNRLSAVLVAAYYNEPDIAQLLVQRGASLDVFEAAAVGALDRMTELIAAQPDLVNAYAPDGFQPLGLASFFGHTPIVEFLLRQGAEVDSPSKNRMRVRPLHEAAQNGMLEVTQWLLDRHANVNAKLADGKTPLALAAEARHEDVVELLRRYGAVE